MSSSEGSLLNDTNEFFNWTYDGVDYGILEPMFNKSFQEYSDVRLMPFWVQLTWTTVFLLMIMTAIIGNCIVIWIVVAHQRMRTVTNYFLVNLSSADLLLTTLNCTFNFIYMIQRDWPFGTWYCAVSNFIANSTVAASVFTLTGISCDRYLAIVHPLQPRMSKTCCIVTILLIWTASMTIASPCLLYSTTITNIYRGASRIGCIIIWPDQKIIGSKYDLWYQTIFLLITYVLPIILMSACYSVMGRVLWCSQSIGEKTQRQLESIRAKRKVVKMFIFIVTVFGICWLPYHGYFIYVYFDTSIIFGKYTQHVYLLFYWFAMSNAMVNPLIYYWMNARFRQYFKYAICGWKNCIEKKMGYSFAKPDGMSHSFSKLGDNATIRLRVTSPRKTEFQRNGNIYQSSPETKTLNNLGSVRSTKDSIRSRMDSSLHWSYKRQKTTVDL